MSDQKSLFDKGWPVESYDGVPQFWDEKNLNEPEKKRLGGHCLKILERLRCGRVSNKELAQISLKYTGRISDLRARGYDVRCVENDRTTGVSFYELVK